MLIDAFFKRDGDNIVCVFVYIVKFECLYLTTLLRLCIFIWSLWSASTAETTKWVSWNLFNSWFVYSFYTCLDFTLYFIVFLVKRKQTIFCICICICMCITFNVILFYFKFHRTCILYFFQNMKWNRAFWFLCNFFFKIIIIPILLSAW